MNNRKNCFRFRMTLLAVMGLCMAGAVYAKDPVVKDYQGVYNDEENLSGTASVTLDAGSLTVGGNAVRNVLAEGGAKLKTGFMTIGSWDYVYQKGADGKSVKIGLVFRIKAGKYDKVMLGLGRQFAEKLYDDSKDQFKLEGKVTLADIPADLAWSFFGTKR